MSTNSSIAIKKKSGEIDAIYSHWDGYIEHNGAILYKYYKNVNKVKKLISRGNVSSLDINVDPPKGRENKHTYRNPIKGVTIFQKRELQHGDEANHRTYDSIERYMEFECQGYDYLFDETSNEWLVSIDGDYNNYEFIPLKYSFLIITLFDYNYNDSLIDLFNDVDIIENDTIIIYKLNSILLDLGKNEITKDEINSLSIYFKLE